MGQQALDDPQTGVHGPLASRYQIGNCQKFGVPFLLRAPALSCVGVSSKGRSTECLSAYRSWPTADRAPTSASNKAGRASLRAARPGNWAQCTTSSIACSVSWKVLRRTPEPQYSARVYIHIPESSFCMLPQGTPTYFSESPKQTRQALSQPETFSSPSLNKSQLPKV